MGDFTEILIRQGLVSLDQVSEAQQLAREGGMNLGDALIRLGYASGDEVMRAVAQEHDLDFVNLDEVMIPPSVVELVPESVARENAILPMAEVGDALKVIISDPLDFDVLEKLRFILDRKVDIALAPREKIIEAINRHYGQAEGESADSMLQEFTDTAIDFTETEDDSLASEEDVDENSAPIVRLVHLMISEAVQLRASDIHIEPFENEFRVRYRIDGVLQDSAALPERLRAAVISRVKIMARLDIAERRLPQDGRVKMIVRGKPIDLRISTLPIMHGESVVMRVLDRDSVELDLGVLGVRDPSRTRLDEILAEPNGIFMVTGPTGSGKTTTLYAALCAINSPEKKVVTVEDPIEYQLDGVNQVQVRPGIGLSFANVLRSMLRQDPDIIMVGEIRDGETARIAAQAALTGHLVLSTLHTNDAVSAVTRLLDMGVEDYLLTSTLTGIAAQRLVRQLCPQCREPYVAMDEIVERFGLRQHRPDGEITLFHARGCDACNGRGYLGRTVVIEALKMTDRIRALVLRHADAAELQRAAVEEGMRTMFEDGVTKALDGITTLEEVMRTTRDV